MMAGESAQRVYEQQRSSRRGRVRRSWRRIIVAVVVAFALGWLLSVVLMSVLLSVIESIGAGGDVSFRVHVPPLLVSLALGIAFSVKPATMLLAPSRTEVAWRKGAEGEWIVGAALDALGDDDGIQVLHDRKIPGSRANIDHVAVAPAGVFTVDAKRYSGRLEVRARGREIWIKGRNRSKLLEQAHRQAETVSSVLDRADIDGVSVIPVLCFVDTELPWLFRPKQADGVVLSTPRKLRKRLLAPAGSRLAPSQLSTIVAVLDAALVPAEVLADRREALQGAPATTTDLVSGATAGPALAGTPASPPSCGRCGHPMVTRQRRSDGSRFYGCSAFPQCRHTQPFR